VHPYTVVEFAATEPVLRDAMRQPCSAPFSRVRGTPNCHPLVIGIPELDGCQSSPSPFILRSITFILRSVGVCKSLPRNHSHLFISLIKKSTKRKDVRTRTSIWSKSREEHTVRIPLALQSDCSQSVSDFAVHRSQTPMKPSMARPRLMKRVCCELTLTLDSARMILTSSSSTPVNACPYHGPVLNFESTKSQPEQTAMTRWLAEGPHEAYAVFVRPDNGRLSVSKSCDCETLGGELEMGSEGI
jgi:hypothetical protein